MSYFSDFFQDTENVTAVSAQEKKNAAEKVCAFYILLEQLITTTMVWGPMHSFLPHGWRIINYNLYVPYQRARGNAFLE